MHDQVKQLPHLNNQTLTNKAYDTPIHWHSLRPRNLTKASRMVHTIRGTYAVNGNIQRNI